MKKYINHFDFLTMKIIHLTKLDQITGGGQNHRSFLSTCLTAGISAGSYAVSQLIHHRPIKIIGLIGSAATGALTHLFKPIFSSTIK